MFNIGAGELIVILIIALIVLGPDKLPDAVRRAGRLYGELRRMSSGFQAELRDALDEPMREMRSTADLVKGTFTAGIGSLDDDHDEPAPAKATKLLTDEDGHQRSGVDAGVDALDPDDELDTVSGDRPVPLPPPAAAPMGFAAPLPGQVTTTLPAPGAGER